MPGNERSQLLHSKPSLTHSLIISVALNTERKNKRPSELLLQMEVQGEKKLRNFLNYKGNTIMVTRVLAAASCLTGTLQLNEVKEFGCQVDSD